MAVPKEISSLDWGHMVSPPAIVPSSLAGFVKIRDYTVSTAILQDNVIIKSLVQSDVQSTLCHKTFTFPSDENTGHFLGSII